MKLVLISPERDEPCEIEILRELFSAGLERYHVRKPHASAADLENWVQSVPVEWRSRLILHQHHALVPEMGLGGQHWRGVSTHALTNGGRLTSRSCHEIVALRNALGTFDSVFFGPLFFSISKPGYGPSGRFSEDKLRRVLARRTAIERKTSVLALGGVTSGNVGSCREIGFDGVAVLGAVWEAADPIGAFRQIQSVCGSGETMAVGATVVP